jgi:glutathione S-transferase
MASSSTPALTVHHLQVGQGERIPFLLEELNIPYTLKLHKRDPLFSPPELKALHPMGGSPVVVDATFNPSNPLVLAESGAIVEYLIHKHGNGRLALPPSHPNYADYLYWFHFSNSNLQPGISRRLGQQPTDPRYAMTGERIHKMFSLFNERVTSHPYLAGEEFTAADIMSVWCFTTMRMWVPNDLGPYPGILAWLERCTTREGYRRAMEKGDPELKIEELISAKGPEMFGPLRKKYEAEMKAAAERTTRDVGKGKALSSL